MLTYILGPLLSIFPRRWREALPFSGYVRWARATAISGIAESVAALVVLSHWYLYAMNTWVGRGVDAALSGPLSGKSAVEVRPQDIGGVALIVWASHPLTWLIGYFGLEGALRHSHLSHFTTRLDQGRPTKRMTMPAVNKRSWSRASRNSSC